MNKRILVAEDEFLLGLMLQEHLHAEGYEVVGPFADLDSLIKAAASERLQGAVLDVNLRGQMVFSALDVLAARQVPFVLLSGYQHDILPEKWRDTPLLPKPCHLAMLSSALMQIVEPADICISRSASGN